MALPCYENVKAWWLNLRCIWTCLSHNHITRHQIRYLYRKPRIIWLQSFVPWCFGTNLLYYIFVIICEHTVIHHRFAIVGLTKWENFIRQLNDITVRWEILRTKYLPAIVFSCLDKSSTSAWWTDQKTKQKSV